ncbi:MAG TPA: cupredoxin domain-containing protein [Burkholderiales bacterium]|nr:cupredoxin domain-containing protein [Burkholderiales bacterium]
MKRRAFVLGGIGAALSGAGAWALAQPKEQVVKIVARKFTFLPNTVTLKKGVPAVLEFTAPEVVMGFNAPDLKIRADIVPGEVARVRFTPDKAGTFDYVCDIFCGDGHERMGGKIRVI